MCEFLACERDGIDSVVVEPETPTHWLNARTIATAMAADDRDLCQKAIESDPDTPPLVIDTELVQ